MVYLTSFSFPDADREFDFRLTVKRTCFSSLYPFGVLSAKGLLSLEFEPVTLLYGGNGKKTLDEVLEHNINKLKKRYPEGFSVDRSNVRYEHG